LIGGDGRDETERSKRRLGGELTSERLMLRRRESLLVSAGLIAQLAEPYVSVRIEVVVGH
jgi:hypothetical protein